MNTHHRKLIAALSLCAAVVPNLALAVAISGQGTWESTLQGRDLDGNLATFEAYYDTALDITWLANANHGVGGHYDWADGFNDGLMTWANANAWAASLNPYGSGVTGWRLPAVSPVDGTTADDASLSYIGTEDLGYNVSAPGTAFAGSTASELAHLFYNTLGNKGYCDPTTSTVSNCVSQPGYGLYNTGPFSNVQAARYWSATEFAPSTSNAWGFINYRGSQFSLDKTNRIHVWAVHAGDVGTSAVPVPPAAWLLASGLLGLIGMRAKRR